MKSFWISMFLTLMRFLIFLFIDCLMVWIWECRDQDVILRFMGLSPITLNFQIFHHHRLSSNPNLLWNSVPPPLIMAFSPFSSLFSSISLPAPSSNYPDPNSHFDLMSHHHRNIFSLQVKPFLVCFLGEHHSMMFQLFFWDLR